MRTREAAPRLLPRNTTALHVAHSPSKLARDLSPRDCITLSSSTDDSWRHPSESPRDTRAHGSGGETTASLSFSRPRATTTQQNVRLRHARSARRQPPETRPDLSSLLSPAGWGKRPRCGAFPRRAGENRKWWWWRKEGEELSALSLSLFASVSPPQPRAPLIADVGGSSIVRPPPSLATAGAVRSGGRVCCAAALRRRQRAATRRSQGPSLPLSSRPPPFLLPPSNNPTQQSRHTQQPDVHERAEEEEQRAAAAGAGGNGGGRRGGEGGGE